MYGPIFDERGEDKMSGETLENEFLVNLILGLGLDAEILVDLFVLHHMPNWTIFPCLSFALNPSTLTSSPTCDSFFELSKRRSRREPNPVFSFFSSIFTPSIYEYLSFKSNSIEYHIQLATQNNIQLTTQSKFKFPS